MVPILASSPHSHLSFQAGGQQEKRLLLLL